MSLENFNRTGIFANGIKVADLIENLKEYQENFGNQQVKFAVHGEEDCFVQFEPYGNALVIYAEEEDPR